MASMTWRTGVNMREFAYYDRPECRRYPNATPPTREAQLRALTTLGIPFVRFFAAHRVLDVDANVAQVGKTLDLLQQMNMQAVVCLGDAIFESGFTIPGDDSFHNDTPMGHFNRRYWRDRDYEQHYVPYIRRLVERFADHPAVALWELANEPAIHPQPADADDFDAFIRFVEVASGEIRQRSPKKPITTGLINTNQITPAGSTDAMRRDFARRLYSLPTVDVISLHVYAENDEDSLALIDVDAANTLGKPFFVGELGADIRTMSNRSPYIQQQMQLWKDRGAFCTMLWAFDDSPYDSGVADTLGFARLHPDFADISRVVSSFAAPVETTEVIETLVPVVESVTPVGTVETVVVTTETRIDPIGVRTMTTNTSTTPPFTLNYPMQWRYHVEARFNDPANYSSLPNKVQRREGMLFVPETLDQPLQVRAAQRGRVTRVDTFDQGYGNFVCITHDWYGDTFVTWYGHLASVGVRVGQNVNTGDEIGVAGRSGSADKVCLFFTLQHRGKGLANYVVDDVVDALPFLGGSPIERDEAAYEADATVVDGEIKLPGETFKKIWQVRNTGTTSWGDGYELAYFSDEQLGTTNSVPLPRTPPGALNTVAVDMVAPKTPGIHRSTWKPRSPNGVFFPNEQYVVINVRESKRDTAAPLLRFDKDITFKDGSPVAPGEVFTKVWRVRNAGNKVWDEGYVLAFAGGERMSPLDNVPLPRLRPGQLGEISLNLTAPTRLGLIRTTWKPRDPQGNIFDYELYAEVNVKEPGKLNLAERFAAPITANWSRGAYRFMTPVPYGDGKHKGVDYIANEGAPVVAGGIGTVYGVFPCDKCRGQSFFQLGLTQAEQDRAFTDLKAGYTYGFGNLIVVRYAWSDLPEGARRAMTAKNFKDFYAFVYHAHLTDDLRVKEGDVVQAGTLLGFVGNTGNSTKPHLHLEMRCLAKETPTAFSGAANLIDPETSYVF